MDKRVKNILSELVKKDGYLTAETLAEPLQVSVKTLRGLIKELNQILADHGAYVDSKYGAGYMLAVSDKESFGHFLDGFLGETLAEIPGTSEERVQFLIEYLFEHEGFVKLDDLSDLLFVTKRTLSTDLKEVEQKLNKFHVKLARRPNYGIRIEGKEVDQRLCLASCVAQKLKTEKDEDELEQIYEGLAGLMERCKFSLSDSNLQNLVFHLHIAVRRIRSGCYVAVEEERREKLRELLEYDIAEEVAKWLEEQFSIRVPEQETLYITMHLAGKVVASEVTMRTENLIITGKMDALVTGMLEVIWEAFKQDFRNDLELRMSLGQHLVPLSIRIRYGLKMKNPLLSDIKERFGMAYAMAAQAVTVLNSYYGSELDENEVGYIALAIALAIERKKSNGYKKNLLIVCASGKGSAKFLEYRYRQQFGPYINKLYICDINQVSKMNFDHIDYVFTTVPLKTKVPVPIMQVEYFLEDRDISMMKKVLSSSMENGEMNRYYPQELFLPVVKGSSKEEILRFMCSYMKELLKLPEGFYQSVLKRESLAATAFGNQVAMPHAYEAMSPRTVVCVGILEQPVLWGSDTGQIVQVVFLVAVENRADVDLQHFYDITSAFLLSSKCISRLIKKRSYSEMMKLMLELEANNENQ